MRWLSAISCRATHVKYSQLSWRVEAKCQSVVTLLASFDAGRRVPVLSIWCIAGLKHSFLNPSHRSVLFLQDWLHGFPGLAGIRVCRNCRYDASECTATSYTCRAAWRWRDIAELDSRQSPALAPPCTTTTCAQRPTVKKVKVAHTRLPSVGFRNWLHAPLNTYSDSDVISFYTVSQKKQDTKLLAITSLTIIRFSKFFQ